MEGWHSRGTEQGKCGEWGAGGRDKGEKGEGSRTEGMVRKEQQDRDSQGWEDTGIQGHNPLGS